MINPDQLDSLGGAVSFESRFYVDRPADEQLLRLLRSHESIILLKGPRQVGKTTLIGSGIGLVTELGWRCVSTDFQSLSARQIDHEEALYRAVASSMCMDLGIDFVPSEHLDPDLGPNLSMKRFLRTLVGSSDLPLVWFIDEADRLFSSPVSSDFFGLIRSCHNARATDLRGPWSRLSVVIGYATEAHLFIDNLNQSPFNVGRPVPLAPFTLDNVQDLNERYGRPIKSDADVQRLHALIGGQPYLTRRALDAFVRGESDVASLLKNPDREDGPFGEHLRRILVSVMELPFVWKALKDSMSTTNLPDSKGVQRLVAAGVLINRPPHGFALANELYRRYISRYIGDPALEVVVQQAQPTPASANKPAVVDDGEELIAHLVRIRKERKILQSTIAEQIGITQARLSQIENMQGGVPLETLLAYARAIGANISLRQN